MYMNNMIYIQTLSPLFRIRAHIKKSSEFDDDLEVWLGSGAISPSMIKTIYAKERFGRGRGGAGGVGRIGLGRGGRGRGRSGSWKR